MKRERLSAIGFFLVFSAVALGHVGTVDAVVFVIQGEKGAGLDCDGAICTGEPQTDFSIGGDVTVRQNTTSQSATFTRLSILEKEKNDSEPRLCPLGYTHVAEETVFVLCRKPIGDDRMDEVVKVSDYWIDKYEMSVWRNRDCTGGQLGEDMDNWSMFDYWDNGDWRESGDAYACSLGGATPTRYMTWFQAQQACRASGKSLCTNAEWQAAAYGTPDSSDRSFCHIHTTSLPADAVYAVDSETILTGSATGCISGLGVNDMVGNVAEWVTDWLPGGTPHLVTDVVGYRVWPEIFNRDIVWNLNGYAKDGDEKMVQGLPGALLRGGAWLDGEAAGVYSVSLEFGPTADISHVGARCCLSH